MVVKWAADYAPERECLYRILKNWLDVAEWSARERDYQGELVAWGYIKELVNTLMEAERLERMEELS